MALIVAVMTKLTNPSTNARIRLRKLRKKVTCMRISHGKSISRPAEDGRNGSETNVAIRRCAIATCVTLTYLAGIFSGTAADLSVMVVDEEGHGVGEVVVTATPLATHTIPALKPAVMDQRNLAFAPRVLVVGVGTSVEFPNNDSVSHQVYSFSPAKRFQLPLYKGEVHPPVLFDRAGLVILGCNIHDSMVGYIVVTDAPYFGSTESEGTLQLKELPPGDYRITLWSPFIADPPASLIRTVHVDDAPVMTRVQLGFALRSHPEPRPRRRDWDY
jgi:plastocyanin